MKKGALILFVLACFCFASVSVAAPYRLALEDVGLSVDLPDGMIAAFIQQQDQRLNTLMMLVEDREDIVFWYGFHYVDIFKGRWLNDFYKEELDQLVWLLTQTTAAVDDIDYIDVKELGYARYIVTVSANSSQMRYITVQDGWVSDLMVRNVENKRLSDAELEILDQLAASIKIDASLAHGKRLMIDTAGISIELPEGIIVEDVSGLSAEYMDAPTVGEYVDGIVEYLEDTTDDDIRVMFDGFMDGMSNVDASASMMDYWNMEELSTYRLQVKGRDDIVFACVSFRLGTDETSGIDDALEYIGGMINITEVEMGSSITQLNGVTYLAMTGPDGYGLQYVTLQRGWFVSITASKINQTEITDEDGDMLTQLVMGISF